MAAAEMTETNFNIVGEVPVEASVSITTQNDWVLLPHAGALHITGKNFYDGGCEATAVSYPTLTVDLLAGYEATDTSIAYDGAAADMRVSGGYYVVVDATQEIMFVQTDSGYDGATGTLSVKRGALGTTAAAITNDDILYVLSTLIFTSAHVGTQFFRYYPLPADPNVGYYE